MKKLLISLLSLFIAGCGSSDSASFSGVWQGTFRGLSNECPFSLRENLNSLFPMTVSEDANGIFTVDGAEGSRATGQQGDGEEISFTASAPFFGDVGPILPFVCDATSTVSFLTTGSSESKIAVVVSFTNCTNLTDTDSVDDCSATYRWDGAKL